MVTKHTSIIKKVAKSRTRIAKSEPHASFVIGSKLQTAFNATQLCAKYGDDKQGLRHILIGHQQQFRMFIPKLKTRAKKPEAEITKEDENLLEDYLRASIQEDNYIGLGKTPVLGRLVHYFKLKKDKALAVCIHVKNVKKKLAYITTAYVVENDKAMAHIQHQTSQMQQYNQLAAPASQDAAFSLCSKSQKDFKTSKLFAKYGNDGEGLRHILIGHRKEFGPFIKSLPTTKTQIDKSDEKLLENYIRGIIKKNTYIGMGKKQSGNLVYYFGLMNDKTMAVCIHAKGGKNNPVYITTAYVVPHDTAMTHIGNMKPRSNAFKILFVLVFIAIVVYLLSKLYFHFH